MLQIIFQNYFAHNSTISKLMWSDCCYYVIDLPSGVYSKVSRLCWLLAVDFYELTAFSGDMQSNLVIFRWTTCQADKSFCPIQGGCSETWRRKINRCIFVTLFYSFYSPADIFFYKFKLFLHLKDSIHDDWWLYFPKDFVLPQSHCQTRQSLIFWAMSPVVWGSRSHQKLIVIWNLFLASLCL